jgi:hypothetical protein
VRPAFDLPGPHWEQGLRLVQRLDLRLLIDAEDECAIGRRHVQADDVAHFLDKKGSFDSVKAAVRCG